MKNFKWVVFGCLLGGSVFSMDTNLKQRNNMTEPGTIDLGKKNTLLENVQEIDIKKINTVFLNVIKQKAKDAKGKKETTCTERYLYGRGAFRLTHFASHFFDVLEAVSISSSLFTKNISNFYMPTNAELGKKLLRVSSILDLVTVLSVSGHSASQKAQKAIAKKMQVNLVCIDGEDDPEVDAAKKRQEGIKQNFRNDEKNKEIDAKLNMDAKMNQEAEKEGLGDPMGEEEKGYCAIRDEEMEKLDRCGVQFWDIVDHVCYYTQYLLWTGSYVLKNTFFLTDDNETQIKMVEGSILCDVGNITASLLVRISAKLKKIREEELKVSGGQTPKQEVALNVDKIVESNKIILESKPVEEK